MVIPFSIIERAPIDRYFSYPPPPGAGVSHVLALGTNSYVISVELEFGGESSSNVLIGRYSSLAHQLRFNSGMNHIYKNSVTLFPFDSELVYNNFMNYGKTYLRESIPRSRRQDNHYQIIIGNDVWVGSGATIVSGVKIGSGAIIGSNAMVTKDIPPYAVAVGNPARVVKYRFDEGTIKKFMAVRWWNWDLDKICANVHKMYDVENFLAEHYRPELEIVPEDDVGNEVKHHRMEGRDVYTFIADFRSPYPVWRRVLRGLFQSNLQNVVLIFFIGIGATDKDIEELQNFPNTVEKITSSPTVRCIAPFGEKSFSVHALKNSTYFITNREIGTVDCMDLLHGTDVKIISALDDGIFEGEPLVDWNKI